jgi:predicted phage terminase large subunit-like protein
LKPNELWKATPAALAAELSGGAWRRAPHLTLLARVLTEFTGEVQAGKSPRLIVTMPPRYGKSEMISHWFPVWLLEHCPHWMLMLVSYGAALAYGFGETARNTIEENADRLRVRVQPDSRKAADWRTTAGGRMVSTGLGGALTGKGAHVLIIDDPFKEPEDAFSVRHREKVWRRYQAAGITRLEPGGGIVIVHTRWHEDDLVGRLVQAQDSGGERWQVLNLPAVAEENDALGRQPGEPLCPEWYPLDALEHTKANVDPWLWAALYQQRPAPEAGAVYLAEWLNRFWEVLPNPVDISEWVISLDATFKKTERGSFVVAQCWLRVHGGQFFLVDQIRGRWEFSEAKEQFGAFCLRYPQASLKLIEEAANGPAIVSELSKDIPGMVLVKVQGSKEARARAVSPYWKAGNVILPHPRLAPWAHDFRAEMMAFPAAANDDQVDCQSQALLHLVERSQATFVPRLVPGTNWRRRLGI